MNLDLKARSLSTIPKKPLSHRIRAATSPTGCTASINARSTRELLNCSLLPLLPSLILLANPWFSLGSSPSDDSIAWYSDLSVLQQDVLLEKVRRAYSLSLSSTLANVPTVGFRSSSSQPTLRPYSSFSSSYAHTSSIGHVSTARFSSLYFSLRRATGQIIASSTSAATGLNQGSPPLQHHPNSSTPPLYRIRPLIRSLYMRGR